MDKEIYLEETRSLFKEAIELCEINYNKKGSCNACKYSKYANCTMSCLHSKYNIIDIKTLQVLNINDYKNKQSTCALSGFDCAVHPNARCDMCLIEHMLTNKNIKITKKRINNE